MYAVIADGGKQYRVTPGNLLKVEYRKGQIGEKLCLTPVLAVQEGENLIVEQDQLSSATVLAEVVKQGRNKKVLVFKKKRRKAYRRTMGHRQAYTEVKILEVQR